MKIKINQTIVRLLFLFPIGTILGAIPTIGNIINKLLYIVLIGLLIHAIIIKPVPRRDAIALIVLAVVFTYDCMLTGMRMYNYNELFYLVTWVVYLIYVRLNYISFKKILCQEVKYIKQVIIIWEIIIVISFLLPFGWRGSAFASFSGGQHRMDSASVMILSGILIICRLENYKKKVLWLMVIPSLAIVLSGARTYLGILGVILAVFYYYLNMEHRYRFYLSIIPISMAAVYLIMSTSVMQARMAEMQAASEYFVSRGYNALTGITSGRSTFWLIDLQKYWESPILNRILGNGFNFVQYVNERYYEKPLWAHNDFINIICCNGIVGLFLYFYVYFEMVKCGKPLNMPRKVVIFMTIAFHICCMGNAMFNMLYSYTAAALAVPILLFAMMDDTILPEKICKKSI